MVIPSVLVNVVHNWSSCFNFKNQSILPLNTKHSSSIRVSDKAGKLRGSDKSQYK